MKTVKSIFDTGTITKEVVTRGTTNILFLRITLNETPPSTVELNQHSLTLTTVTKPETFLDLKNDSGTNLPLDVTGNTIEGYKNTDLNQVIIFGIGNITTPRAVYRAEMTADKI